VGGWEKLQKKIFKLGGGREKNKVTKKLRLGLRKDKQKNEPGMAHG